MANVGTATLNVVPKFPGLSAAVKTELSKVDASGIGKKSGEGYGSGFGGGLVKSGAVVGAFAAITNKAMAAISSSMDGAIRRFDTLNNYPQVMESLGYGAEAAELSISKMVGRLDNLPTTLDQMVSLTQGLVTSTNDLDKATDAALGLNDMLVASGASQQLVNSAQEQFRQILSKGKPEMQDWKSLVMAMPGQMDQLAKSMLGPTANANDLYAALGGGKNEQIISMDQLIDEIIRLDKEGGEGFASFQEQAETAAGGVQTSMANARNAVVKGITGVMDEIGKENIAGAFNTLKGGINQAFAIIRSSVPVVLPLVKGLGAAVMEIGPYVAAAAAGFVGFSKVGGIVTTVATRVRAATSAVGLLRGASILLGTSLGPLTLGLGLAGAAIGAIAVTCADTIKRHEDFRTSTVGLAAAVKNTAALDDYAGKIGDIGANAEESAKDLSFYTDTIAEHVQTMRENNEKAQEQIGILNTAQGIINDYAGKTDITTEAQGKLQWAISQVNKEFGLTLTAADVAAGAYTDVEGNVVNLKDSINNLIEAKKNEIKMLTLSDNLSEAYEAQAEAEQAYVDARKRYAQGYNDTMQQMIAAGMDAETVAKLARDSWQQDMDSATMVLDNANKAVSDIEAELGDAAKASSDAADAFDDWGNKVDGAFRTALGSNFANFKDDIRTLGADTEAMSNLSRDQLMDLAEAYDGTTDSIVGKLQEFGVGMNDAAVSASYNTRSIRDSFASLGIESVLERCGYATGDFARALSDAGVSAEDLNRIGSENLAALAEACEGNMSAMVFFIQHYNDTPLLDKDGNVQVDQAQLIDAQGNIYTWNGSELLDKDGIAMVDDIDLIDAQGNKVIWNGTNLERKNASATINHNINESIQSVKNWNSAWNSISAGTKTATLIKRTINQTVTQNAAGGFRLHADGGYRLHASGAIATKATPLDIVGEDGAEAIVPLTNRKYAQPFVDMLADGLKEKEEGHSYEEALRAIYALLVDIYRVIPEFNERDSQRYIRGVVNGRA